MSCSSDVPTLPLFIEGRQDVEAHTLLFVHGWPDDERLFIRQTKYFGKTHRVASVRLPWFSTTINAEADAERYKHSRSGHTLRSISEALAMARHKLGDERAVTVVCHDWGSIVAQMTDLAYPGIFHRMVAIDVSLPRWMVCGSTSTWIIQDILGMIVYGFMYLWKAAFCSVLYPRFPRIAANMMRSVVLYCTTKHFWERPGVRRAIEDDSTGVRVALADYPSGGDAHPLSGALYYDLQKSFWLGLFGLAEKPVAKGPASGKWYDFPSCPVLFIYSGDGPQFHDTSWKNAVSTRTDGSRVMKYDDASHWLQLEKGAELNADIETWLSELGKDDKVE